jgi:hypothetical protein
MADNPIVVENEDGSYGVFYLAPPDPLDVDDPIERLLHIEHEKECRRKGAEFTNYCAFWSRTEFFSRTTKGKLTSTIDPNTKTVSHFWEEYAKQRITEREVILWRALEALVKHDAATDRREGLPYCAELQRAMEVLNEVSGQWTELLRGHRQ